jgi:hypothetical protein
LTPDGQVLLPNMRSVLRGYSAEREKSVAIAAREPNFARASLIPVLRMIMLQDELLLQVKSRELRKAPVLDGGA